MTTVGRPSPPSAGLLAGGATGSADGRRRLPRALPWLAAGLAFSPLLVDLAQHLRAESWARVCLVFPPLLLRLGWRARGRVRPQPDGLLWLGLALALEILGVASGIVRLGRPALALAVIGLCRCFGPAAWPTALLAIWCVPLPTFVTAAASPGLESALATLAATGLGSLGLAIVAEGPRLLSGAHELRLAAHDGGLLLASLLSGLGWYAGARAGAGGVGCALRALAGALAALPLQAAAILLGGVILAVGAPGAAQLVIGPGLWVATTVVGVALAERGADPRRAR